MCWMRQPGVKSTKQVPRDINPIFKSTVVLMDVDQDDMLEFIVRDVGVFAVAHTGGFGPRCVARGVLRAGEDFCGYLELTPSKEVPEQGPPVLQLTARHSTLLQDPDGLGLPPLGNTSVLSSMFGSAGGPSPEQAVMPSAPSKESWPRAAPEPSPEPVLDRVAEHFEAFGSWGVPGSSDVPAAPMTSLATAPTAPTTPIAESSGSFGPTTFSGTCGSSGVPVAPTTTSGSFGSSGAPAAPTSGVPAGPTPTSGSFGSSGAPAAPTSGVQAAPTTTSGSSGSSGVPGVGEAARNPMAETSSTFWIDPEVFLFCPKGQSMSRLEQMRDRKLLWPFPSSPCRNYNCLAAGFDPATGTWDHLWPGMDKECLGQGFHNVVQQFENFVENKKDHKEYTEQGCKIILKWLKMCQDTLLAHEFIQRPSKFGVLPGSPHKPPPPCIIRSDDLSYACVYCISSWGRCRVLSHGCVKLEASQRARPYRVGG